MGDLAVCLFDEFRIGGQVVCLPVGWIIILVSIEIFPPYRQLTIFLSFDEVVVFNPAFDMPIINSIFLIKIIYNYKINYSVVKKLYQVDRSQEAFIKRLC